MDTKLLATVRFYFAQCVFMHTIHYAAKARAKNQQKKWNRVTIWIAGVTFLCIILRICGLEFTLTPFIQISSYVGLLATGGSMLLSMAQKEDYCSLMCQHKHIAENYKSLRDRYMMLIMEIMTDKHENSVLNNKAQNFLDEYDRIGRNAPDTTGDDYNETQKILGLSGQGEAFTWSDNEIDRFLPLELRLNK